MSLLERIRNGEDGIVAAGLHPRILQSMLDFDYLCGKARPSIVAIVTGSKKAHKCFFGGTEIVIPCVPDFARVKDGARVRFLLNLQSGRRAAEATAAFFDAFPEALGAVLFAENTPEKQATELIARYGGTKLVAGPSSVGFLVPGALKLGAVGGVDAAQIAASRLTGTGTVAVVSTSGGMTNELITSVVRAGKRVSFALAIGGDRFPVSSLTEVLALAESDPMTEAVAYFGELGGEDEYEIAHMIESGTLTKPVCAYVAGIIDEAFDERMQFGHAKALAQSKDESARAKREALRAAGATAPDTFAEFLDALGALPGAAAEEREVPLHALASRRESILSTRRVADLAHAPSPVENGKLSPGTSFTASILAALLGRKPKSEVTVAFAETVFGLLIDHGGEVSGAVTTMVTARAGKDLVSSLAAGLLTIGPRFGGAINDAAKAWRAGVASGMAPAAFVEREAKAGRLILGIGHKKYRVGVPDPRVESLAAFAGLLKEHPHYDFARGVEKVTTAKKGTLILNVDGVVAALALDILRECEGLSDEELAELSDAELFNAFFVIPRSVGFIAHFLEQKKHDEGLFRLPSDLLFTRERED